MKRSLLPAVAVAAVLLTAASAHASYCEYWHIYWGGGTIYYNDGTYTLHGGDGYIWCIQGGDDCVIGG